MRMDTSRDKDGNEWAPFLNKFQQRMLRCVAGARQGEEMHDPRLYVVLEPQAKPAPKMEPFYESLYVPAFWEH